MFEQNVVVTESEIAVETRVYVAEHDPATEPPAVAAMGAPLGGDWKPFPVVSTCLSLDGSPAQKTEGSDAATCECFVRACQRQHVSTVWDAHMLDVSDPPVIIRGTMEDHAPNALQRLMTRARGWRTGHKPSAPVLLPLTPKYDPGRHGVYFDVIESALTDSKREVRNIALTGSYGVGKSSILAEVTRRHKRDVIAVSLSILGFPDEEPQPAGGVAKAASTKTTRIQKEIVM